MSDKPSFDPEAVFATLADLISINSVNPNYPGGSGEGEIAEYISRFFEKNRLPFEVQPVREGRPNVIAKLEGRPGAKTLVLEAHTDTASELGMSIPPFDPKRERGLMFGRGSCDTKGGLAAMMHAVKAIADSTPKPANSVIMVAAMDEENSFRGVARFAEDQPKADGAIVAEPTKLQTVIASKGVVRWQFHARGRTAHSSKPHLGINAISKMAKLIVAIEEKYRVALQSRQHPLLGSPTFSIGLVQGGVQVNQVPASCTVDVDRRTLPGETWEQVRREIEPFIAELHAQDSDLEIEIIGPTIEDQGLETMVEERIVQVVGRISGEIKGPSTPLGVPYGSDASKLAAVGIPSIIVGPGDIDQAHAAAEYVELDQVVKATEIYARTLVEF